MTKTQVLHERIAAALRRGQTHAAIAKELRCSRSVVSRVAKRLTATEPAAPPAPAPPEAAATSPREQLRAIRDRWLEVAAKSQEAALVSLRGEKPKATPGLLVQAGIATQRAQEITAWLERCDGLPKELPPDDDEARRLIKNGWWLAATRGGSSSAMTKIAAVYGIKVQRGQPVRMEFGRPGDQANPAPAAAPVPG